MPKGYLTVRQAAARLGLSRPRLQALITDGRLPAEKFGRANMIRETDLDLPAVRHRPPGPRRRKETKTADPPQHITRRSLRDTVSVKLGTGPEDRPAIIHKGLAVTEIGNAPQHHYTITHVATGAGVGLLGLTWNLNQAWRGVRALAKLADWTQPTYPEIVASTGLTRDAHARNVRETLERVYKNKETKTS